MNVMSMFGLQQKVSIVTGATGHLGKALCEGLAEAGSDIAVCSTSLEKAQVFSKELALQYGIRAKGFELDLTLPETLKDVVAAIHEAFGQIDCLVNNAYFGAFGNLETLSADEWEKGFNGAATSAMIMLQAALPYLEVTQGAVINIGSMYGVVSPNPENYEDTPFGSPPNYGAGKAALLQLTRYAAVYLAPKGIRVNAISPGPFPNTQVVQHEDFVDRLAAKVPLKRIGMPHELKGALVFLASEASSYVTGHNLMVDGGWSIW
ncbi:3-oxoacyl-[acyl-carrier-protein] reductase FabG [compost metagenome]